MSFTPISSTAIAPGAPATSTVMGIVKADLDDHQTRITALEGGGNTVYPPIILNVNGPYYVPGASTNIVRTTCNFNLTLTGARIVQNVAGSAGTLQVDILFKRGTGSWTSVFASSGQPSIAYTAGNDATSTAGTLNPAMVNLQAGDLIRIDTLSVQTGAYGFFIRLDYYKT